MRDKLSEEPCPRCHELYLLGVIRLEMVQRLPKGAFAPMGMNGEKHCWDCASAETVARLSQLDFDQARIAVGNDRQEQYRMPGVPLGLVGKHLVKANVEGDHEDQLRWLDEVYQPSLQPETGEAE